MFEEELLGRLVYSRCGRDRNRPLIIIKTLNDRLVLVVDGDLRTLENPKVKNLKHLRMTRRVATEVAEAIARGEPLSNARVRKAIQHLVDTDTDGPEGGLGDG